MEEKKIAKKVEVALNAIPKFELASDTRVSHKFIDLFRHVHGGDGKQMYEVEKFHFNKLLQENKELQTCTNLSLYGAFVDIAVQGLSIDPSRKLAYLYPQSVNVGTKDNKQYEKRAYLKISPRGELYLRQQYGQIRHADNPVLVYEGDKFSKMTGPTGTVINHESIYPRKSNKIIACFFRFVKSDGSIDYGFIDYEGMMRLKGYSERKNFGKANALYTNNNGEPDAGFWEAKCILHAFDSYPKVKLRGQNTVLETETDTETPIDYSIEGENIEFTPVQEEETLITAEEVNTDTGEVKEEAKEEAPKAPTLEEKIGQTLNDITAFTTKTQVNNFCKNLPDEIKKNKDFRSSVQIFLDSLDKPKETPVKNGTPPVEKEPEHVELDAF